MDENNIYVVAGNSADTNKYWYKIYKTMKEAGLKVYCINPKREEVDGNRIYPDFKTLPEKGNVLILVARPDIAEKLVELAIDLDYKEIWFQPGTYSEEAAARAMHAGVQTHDECFMVANGLW